MGTSFKYVKGNKGLMLAIDYPLGDYQYPCHFNDTKSAVQISEYVYLPPDDEELLKNAVAAIGPISVAMDGAQELFYNYFTGIYDNPSCTNELNHAVLIVGYGTDPKLGDYWICKNSWY